MIRSAASIFFAALSVLGSACSSGALGVGIGPGAIHGRVVSSEPILPVARVRVMAGSRQIHTVTDKAGAFSIDNLEPGLPYTVVAIDDSGNAATATANVFAGATTEIGDIQLRADAVASLVGLRGFGLEERVTSNGGDLSGLVIAGLHAYSLRGTQLVETYLPDGSSIVVASIPFFPQGPFELESAGSTLLAWSKERLCVFDLGVRGFFVGTVDLLPNVERRLVSGAATGGPLTATLLSSNTGAEFSSRTIQQIDLSRADVGVISASALPLAHGAAMSLRLLDVDSRTGDAIYLPLLRCATNPDCTDEEFADEAAGLGRIQRLSFATRGDSVVAKVPDALLSPGYAFVHGVADAGGGDALYLSHGEVVRRISLTTGNSRDLDIPAASLLAVPPEEDRLVLGLPSLRFQLIELPSLAKHALVVNPEVETFTCCDQSTSFEFRANGGVQASGLSVDPFAGQSNAVWLDFSSAGALQRKRSIPSGGPVPQLLRRSDGTEVTVGPGPRSGHSQLLVAPPGNGTVSFQQLSFIESDHLSPALDGQQFVYYLVRDPVSGFVQLFRMELP